MKVLIFTSQFVHGAAERLAAELAISLNRSGVHADILSMYTASYPGADTATRELLTSGVPNVHFLGLEPHPNPLAVATAIARVNKLIREENYDVLETSSTTPSLITAWARMGTEAKHLVGLHFSFDRQEHSSAKIRALAWSVRFNSRTHFYAVSNSARDAWEDYAKVPRDRIAVIYNCIQDRYFHATSIRSRLCQELGISTTSHLALCAGRIATYKQQDHVIDAVGPICESNDIVVLFVGDADANVPGSPAMLARMTQTIHERGLTKRFLFLGYRSDLDALMASCDLLVHPSAKEAFGLVLAEALATGLLVVSTDIDGTREVLDGTDSILVRPNDVNALQAGILTALSTKPEALEAMSARGKVRASAFRQEDRTLNMIKLFQAL